MPGGGGALDPGDHRKAERVEVEADAVFALGLGFGRFIPLQIVVDAASAMR